MKSIKKGAKWAFNNKFLFLNLAMFGFFSWRINVNFDAFEKAIKKERIFDITKANEQLKIYKEIYDPVNDVEVNSRLLNAASPEDKSKIKQIFQKYEEMDINALEKEIKKLKEEVQLMEETRTSHQGLNLARIYSGYQPSEEAIQKIREHYNKKKIEMKNEKNKKHTE